MGPESARAGGGNDKMTTEKRLFDFAKWLICAAVLLAAFTACSPYDGLRTATPTPAATATKSQSQDATVIPTPTPRACIVSTGIDAGKLNLRSGAGVDYSVIAYLHEGQKLNIIPAPVKGNWIQITAGTLSGWINSNYCRGAK